MNLRKGEWLLVIFTALYIIGFAWYYLSIQDYEFMWYVFVLVMFALLVASTLRKSNFDYVALWGLSLWGLFHMVGGGVPAGDGVVYGLEIIRLFEVGDTYVLKMDQLIHIFGFGVATLVGYQLLRPRAKKMSRGLLYGLLFFIGMGGGAINELVEFAAVVYFPETGVGGYFNTGLDIVANGVGVLIALVLIHFGYEKR
jgi:hypothetical protein